MSETLELVVQELQTRIGQMASQYETQLAVVKVHFSQELQARDEKIAELEKKTGAAKPKDTEK